MHQNDLLFLFQRFYLPEFPVCQALPDWQLRTQPVAHPGSEDADSDQDETYVFVLSFPPSRPADNVLQLPFEGS